MKTATGLPGPVAVLGQSRDARDAIRKLLAASGFHISDGSTVGQRASDVDRPRVVVAHLADDIASADVVALIEQCRESTGAAILGVIPPHDDLDFRALLELRLDDHLFLPIRPFELLARIEMFESRHHGNHGVPLIERRREGRRRGEGTRRDIQDRVGDLLIDEAAKCIWLRGRPLHLSPREYELLGLLASQPGRVFSAEEIVSRLWPKSRPATAADVHQHIYLLRRRIEEDPTKPQRILTVKGFGYVLRESPEQ